MSAFMDLVGKQLGNVNLNSLGSQLGLSPEATQSAVAHSLPAMIASLAEHVSSSPEAADAVHESLGASPQLSAAAAAPADAVIAAPSVAEAHAANVDDATLQQIANSSGIEVSQLRQLLPQLAPVLTAALQQAKTTQDLSPSGVTGLLQNAREHLSEQAGNAVQFAKTHQQEIESGAIGAGMAFAGNYVFNRLFGKKS